MGDMRVRHSPVVGHAGVVRTAPIAASRSGLLSRRSVTRGERGDVEQGPAPGKRDGQAGEHDGARRSQNVPRKARPPAAGVRTGNSETVGPSDGRFAVRKRVAPVTTSAPPAMKPADATAAKVSALE